MKAQSEIETRPRRWSVALPDGRLECRLCPRACRLRDGQHGFCFVRQRQGEEIRLTTYGRSSGFCIDPIEKKPLYHFHPGSTALSFGTAGCNLGCRFCQNWHISKARAYDRLGAEASPEQIARSASQHGCRSVAFTYNDPVVFAEYAIDVADACRAAGIRTVAVTAGYINAEPRAEFFGAMDAANIDLKGFSDDFYHRLCYGELGPVLDTLLYVKHQTSVWLEVTTLLIPGENDGEDELERATDWFAEHLGPDVPWHFTAFHPDFKMQDTPPTPRQTLERARRLARLKGLKYVYLGNVRDGFGETTFCPECGATVIERNGYDVVRYELTANFCRSCGAPLPGVFPVAPAG
ncbi:MAG TPA: AmmeMemoRadiSam system radical SAM enzyme [Opitutaceae bacterium]|nr:AmmeMemoRadiSam system radical SAM enzyme [Opitutaceae bacterium]